MHIHACLHTHTYIHTYIHKYIQAYVQIHRHKYIRASVHMVSEVRQSMRPMFDTARQRQQRGQPVVMQSALENACNEMAAADAWRGERHTSWFEVDLSPRVKKGVAGQKVEQKHGSSRVPPMTLSIDMLRKYSFACMPQPFPTRREFSERRSNTGPR